MSKRLTTLHSSLPEYDPDQGRVQELDALHVENILTTSYLQESQDTSYRHVPSLYLPPPMSGRRITASVTSIPTEDVLNVSTIHLPTLMSQNVNT